MTSEINTYGNLDFPDHAPQTLDRSTAFISRVLTLEYSFYKNDKYNRPMYFVKSDVLEDLYNICKEENRNIPLFKNSEGTLIMILSNGGKSQQIIGRVKIGLYQGKLRFYEVKNIEYRSN